MEAVALKKHTKRLFGAACAACAVLLAAPLGANAVSQHLLSRSANAYIEESLSSAVRTHTQTSGNLVLGDVNEDGQMNALDARIALQGVAGLRGFSERQLAAADFDCDNAVSLREVRIILRGAAQIRSIKEAAFGITDSAVPTDTAKILQYYNFVCANLKVSEPGLTMSRTYFTRFSGGVENPFTWSLLPGSDYAQFDDNAALNTLKNDTTEYADTQADVVYAAGTDLTDVYPSYGELRGDITASDISAASMQLGDSTYTLTLTCPGASFALPKSAALTPLGKVFPMLTTESQYRSMLLSSDHAQYADYITAVNCNYADCTLTCVVDADTDMLISAVFSMPYTLTNDLSVTTSSILGTTSTTSVSLETAIRDVVTFTVG